MKLSKTLNYINQALNYPALIFNDVSLFFDSAITELNTTLHTGIPLVTEMIEEFRQRLSKNTPKVTIAQNKDPQFDPTIPSSAITHPKYYYNASTKLFYILDVITNTYQSAKSLNGVYIRNAKQEDYKAVVYGQNASWQIYDANVLECEFSEYFPDEWVILWLIPYVCFKYTVRDGGTASSFAEELTQGFQQLQDTYNVPERTILATVAEKEAYKSLVSENLANLNIYVRTRAIYEYMKHDRVINARFGSMYDRGGF